MDTTIIPELDKILEEGKKDGLTDQQLDKLANDFIRDRQSYAATTPPAPAPWYSEQGVNERLAPVDVKTETSFTNRLLAPEINASKQALRTMLGMAAHPIDTLMGIPNMLKGGVDIVAGVPSEQRQMVEGELDRRGLGLDMSQTAGERWGKASDTLLAEPLTPPMDVALGYGAKKGIDAAKQWWLPQEQRVAPPLMGSKEIARSNDIRKGYNKAIRTSVSGKGSFTAIEGAEGRSQAAMEAIVKNQDVLKLTDENGVRVKGLPKTLRQFSQAIDQLKRRTFEKYNDMARKASAPRPGNSQFVRANESPTTVSGLRFDMSPVSNAIMEEVGKSAFKNISPKTVQEAKAFARRLRNGKLTPVEVQEHIATLNSKVEAYLKNPNPNDATMMTVYSRALIELRKTLDDGISKLEGPGYQALKNEYGALKSIENEVAHRVVVHARQNNSTLADLVGNFGTAAELVYALSKMEPSRLAAAGGWQLVKRFHKWRNDPNVIIDRTFKKTEKMLAERQPKRGEPLELPTMSDVEKSNAAVAAREAEPAKAAAKQAAWKAKTQASDEAAAAATARSAEELKGLAKEREPLVVDKTFEGIPEGREIVLEGISERGKKFSYKENARAAYMESKETIESLSNASGDLIEGEGSVMRTMNKHKVPPAVRVTVMKRIRAYITEGLGKEDAAISAIADTVAEFEKTRKEVVRQTGLVE